MLNENKPLISIVIPIYKVENYIRRCVDSVIGQSYKEIEVWLVDDGSPDECGKICDMYAATDDRIHVIHKCNGGLSDARNAAIPKCSGEYITFVDSDDWISIYYIENLVKAIIKNDSDLAISWFENIFDNSNIKNRPNNTLIGYTCINSMECLEKMLYQDGVETSAWGKLYKAEIIKDLRYPVNKIYEDIPVTYECIKRAHNIALICNVDYYYFQRKDSIQNDLFSEKKLDGIVHCKSLMESVKNDFPELFKAACCRYFSVTCNILFQIQDKSHEDIKKELWNEIVKYRNIILFNRRARKKARIAAAISYMGHGMLSVAYKKTQWRG
ncbi:MAG: glycosyltransferase family 2 protein [Floccifex sp.]